MPFARPNRREHLKQLFGLGLAPVAITGAWSAHAADAYPSRPIRWVVPYGAGGGTDVTARTVAKYWAPLIGGSFVVDNKPGGQTVIGAQSLLTSPADGYTIMSIVDNFPVLPLMVKKLPFDIDKDFAFVSTLVRVPFFLLVSRDSSIKNLRDAMEAIRTKGDKMNYGSYGLGSTAHLAMEDLLDRVGGSVTHVPYQGSAATMTALMSNQIDLVFVDTSTALPLIKDGRVRALGISTKNRNASFPDVPSLHEQGVSEFDQFSWQGVVVRQGTPEPIVKKLGDTLREVVKNADLLKEFASRGYDVYAGTPDQFRQHVAAMGTAAKALVVKRKINLVTD